MRLLGNDPVTPVLTAAEFERAVPWIEADDYDLTIEAFLSAAQEVVEVASRRPLTQRSVEFEFDVADGFCRWWLPVAPVSAITDVAAVQPLAADVPIPLQELSLQRGYDEPCVWFSEIAQTIADPGTAETVRVQATVGFEANKAPQGLKQAVILLVKEWYDAGVSVGDLEETKVSFGVQSLIKQRRYVRPKGLG